MNFYHFKKLHFFCVQRITVLSADYTEARTRAKEKADSGFLLFCSGASE